MTTKEAATDALVAADAERYRLVFENAPVGILQFDAGGVVTAANHAMVAMLGGDQAAVIGLDMHSLLGAEKPELIGQLVEDTLRGGRARYEGRYRSQTTGRMLDVSALFAPIHGPDGAVHGGVVIVADVTERKRTQAQLARAERMASIGTLAAGVAHEINNPLVYVTLGLELIERELSHPDKLDLARLRAYCKDAIEGAERVRNIVRDLRAFSRPNEERVAPLDVEKVLESSINMAMSHIRPRARLERDYQPLPPVSADESRLGQVFLNLLVNAAQAIPEGAPDTHRIVLRTRAGPKGEAIVEVEDTGVGIEGWKLERIFEPFFTDKPVGVGTGLGLSIAHGIVSRMGGEIAVRSEPGRGSVFRVSLPAKAPQEEDAPPRDPAAPAPPPQRPRILLVDDEPNLGVTLATGLRARADVVAARSGAEAIAILLAEEFDLILCDLMMPGVTGMDVFEQVIRARPELRSRFVFTTGGAVTERARDFLEQFPSQRLDKPFRLEQVEALFTRGK